MPRLDELVGQVILARVSMFDAKVCQVFKLHAVEPSGLWVENQKLTDRFLTQIGVASSPKALVLFLPFQQIDFVLGSVDAPGLSERAFGVER